MKNFTKLALIVAALAAVGTSAAFADDQQLQNRLALQRSQDSRRAPTIAVYAVKGLTLGRTDSTRQRAESHFELRSNAHGQTFGAYVPGK